MVLEQFKFKKSLNIVYLREATVVTNRDNKVMIFEKEKAYTIRKYHKDIVTFETIVQKDQPERLKYELKRITKRK
jgi:hypothetical protein